MKFFRSEFDTLQKKDSHRFPGLLSRRAQAFNHFTHIGFPTKKWEDWQFTDFSPFQKIHFQLGQQKELNPEDSSVSELLENVYSIVILNGQYQPKRSKIPAGILIEPFMDLLEDIQINDQNNPFFLLNTGLITSGLSIQIPDHFHLDKPIHTFFMTSGVASPVMNHFRLGIQLGKNSSVTIIEQYSGIHSHLYWNNCVTLSDVGENSTLNHYRLQEDTGYHTDTIDYHLKDNAVLNMVQFNKDTELYRGDLYVQYDGQNASVQLNGLSLLTSNQHMDTRVMVNHSQPHCQSNQFFKYILDHKATGVFNGKVVVEKNGQKTDSSQSNRNLLLSPSSSMHSNPQLEIYADDVRCSHGSSTGQLNEDALYYMRSRGIDIHTSQMLMVEGFAGEVFSHIKDKAILNIFQQRLSTWLEELDHG
ncbi:MAG: Fe-S cluster assembly protein SufD [Fidelibacterota bacterium]